MKRRFSLLALTLVFVVGMGSSLAQAGPLFPLQLGGYLKYDALDCFAPVPHTWQSRIWVVGENIQLNGQTYYHIRRENWDPYTTDPKGSDDSLMRATQTQGYVSLGGAEWLMFQTGDIGLSWDYTDDYPATFHCDIQDISQISVPYGTYTAYGERVREVLGPDIYSDFYDKFYLVPDLGLLKEISTDVDFSRVQRTHSLRETGYMGVSLIPLKTGYRAIYNARDNQGHTWQMRLEIHEQVSLGGQTYFRCRRINYDPIGGDPDEEFYIRSTANQVFIYRGDAEYMEFQVGGPTTPQWTVPEGDGDVVKQITAIERVNVLGGSFLAYIHQNTYQEPGFTSPNWYDFIVPGLGIAMMKDYWIDDESRAPLTFELVKMEQGSPALTGMMLLLMDDAPVVPQ